MNMFGRSRSYEVPSTAEDIYDEYVASKRRFWNPKKWFRRKNKNSNDEVVVVEVTEIGKDALRSRSTSELSVAEEGRRRSSSSMHPGLSVSHDSVFHSPNSGSDMELDAAQSSSSLSISQPHVDLRLQSELSERLRLRRGGRGDTSEDDEGLPHSPCNSPTASDGLLVEKTANKDLPTKSHSTCSDGSLQSMGSYDDDDSFEHVQTRHSSKLSLHDKKDSYTEFGPDSTTSPLNHSAAHHRVSVKPKRTHGAPRRRRTQQLSTALPVTPEVNEDSSIRSTSPEVHKKESLIELYSMSSTILTETQLKCSSLPPGLTPPGSADSKLNRSKSNAGSKSQDLFSQLPEDANEKEEKLSLFDRIFPRKSGRKKKKEGKEKADEQVVESFEQAIETSRQETVTDSGKSYMESSSVVTKKVETKPIPAPRSGAAMRQRVIPMDISENVDEPKREPLLPKLSPEPTIEGTSPLQAELESIFKQRQISTSPIPFPRVADTSPSPKSPVSPRLPRNLQSPNIPTVISSKYDYSQVSRHSTNMRFTETKVKSDETRHKLKMPALSSLQQRVLSLNEEDNENSFMSLTDLQTENKPSRPISKSHSFKAVKHQPFSPERNYEDVKNKTANFLDLEKKEDSKISFTKAASLDSVKNFDETMHLSEVKIELKKKPLNFKTEEKHVEVSSSLGDSSITISGPSHTAVVNVTSNVDDYNSLSKNQTSEQIDGSTTISIKEQQVSVTKIQVKRETTQVTQSSITVPEFMNKQLNKVEIKPSSNIVFSMKSPKPAEEQNRPKTLFTFDVETDVTAKPPTPRKFSKDNVEIIEKDASSPKTSPIITVNSPIRLKKSDSRKSSITSNTSNIESPVRERAMFKSKSASLDSLNDTDKSSQDSLDKLEARYKEKDSPLSETVVLRRKSVATKKNEEEPELMKVFARRSLKIKDSDVDALQDSLKDMKARDSDKENQMDSPVEERKKTESFETQAIEIKTKIEEKLEVKSPVKEPSVDNKTSPVVLRRTLNNNVFLGQRAVTINPTKNSDLIIKKQMGFSEHRKTDQWISNIKNEDANTKEDDLLSNIPSGGDFIMEPKNNFSQRKAEWEKRAQQAQKKTTP
ncbi:uncharacterized protein LOC114331514 isoform X2 [Diabrotica virgifera virgifera]|uniref:DUF4592 domain-containing protein n=1 Tax=Diabrotica virgifera virgifera TaxID=50390 RepID=A0ABM5IN19_DIAVI|nr:uncharacterized protein LOC114331514 isoform X2 [Diabrotica virgifera virgifera]